MLKVTIKLRKNQIYKTKNTRPRCDVAGIQTKGMNPYFQFGPSIIRIRKVLEKFEKPNMINHINNIDICHLLFFSDC